MALFSNGPSTTVLTQGEAILAKATTALTTGTIYLFNVPGSTVHPTPVESGFNVTVSSFWSEPWVAAAAAASHNNSPALGNGTLQGTAAQEEDDEIPLPLYSLAQSIVIGIVAVILFLITVVGNFMVMISFKMDKQLQTISNYFLLSLAVADFAIGLVSMPLYTIYLLIGYWPFGAFLCDSYLSLDYLLSNASVLNLLIISFDRYFSVTRPLTYRARRTTKRAIFMISCAWVISLILWPPWIFSWPYIEGKRTVEKHKCYIQFLKTNLYVTFGTAIAAFYIPVTVMCILYWRIWRETEKRQKDLTNLQAVKKDNSKRSTSSDDVVEQEDVANKRSRSDSSVATVQASTMTAPPTTMATQTSIGTDVEIETTYVPTSMCVDNTRYLKVPGRTKTRTLRDILCSTCYKYCKIDRDVPEYIEEDSTSDAGHGSPGNTTPASVETPVQSTVSRCTSLNLRQEPLTAVAMGTGNKVRLDTMIPLLDRPPATGNGVRGVGVGGRISSSATTTPAGPPPRLQMQTRSQSSDSVYTILIRLPLDNVPPAVDNQPSIRMIAEEEEGPTVPLFLHNQKDLMQQQSTDSSQIVSRRKESSPLFERAGSQGSEVSVAGLPNVVRTVSEECSLHPTSSTITTTTTTVGCTPATNRRISQPPETIKLPLNTKLVPKQVVTKAVKKKKKKTQERKQDRKAAKTLSAILLAFIITWTPYNILVLVQTLATCGDECVPNEIWDLVYCLCYINSTVNPLCYALCNASFRRTYVRILTCKWHTKKRNPNRGFYN